MQRRKFLKKTAATSAAFSIVPSFVLGKEHVPPSDTLYIAAFGVGGRGAGVMRGLYETGKVKFVALCDVDERRAAQTYQMLPDVKRYKDYRQVYKKHLKDMDAIMVATPDHTHATIASPLCGKRSTPMLKNP
jgi:hypothetical protein